LAGPKARDFVCARDNNLKLKLDDQERRAVSKSVVDRKTRLNENTEDTTQPLARRRSWSLELKALASVLRKLRLNDKENP
jgi:hypothetical protein